MAGSLAPPLTVRHGERCMRVRMKKLIFPAMLLAASLVLPLPVRADDSPLAKEMEKLDDAYKAFRRETDPAKGAAAAREAQGTVLKAIPLVPAMVDKMPAGEDKDKADAGDDKDQGDADDDMDKADTGEDKDKADEAESDSD